MPDRNPKIAQLIPPKHDAGLRNNTMPYRNVRAIGRGIGDMMDVDFFLGPPGVTDARR